MHIRCLAILTVSLPAALAAQADSVRAVVEGKVLDPLGNPLAQTEIVWPKDRRSVLTRSDGSFNLVVPVRGETVILVRRPGYSAQVLRVDLSKGMWRGDLVLEPGAFQLPDLEVAAKYAKPAEYAGTTKYDDFFRRQRLGLGTFISREQIERMNAFHTLEALRNIPGLYVNVGIPSDPATADIRMARCQTGSGQLGKVTVWIDGVRQVEAGRGEGGAYSVEIAKGNTTAVGGSNQGGHGRSSYVVAEMLSRVSASGIEMIEVYRGVSQIPGEFSSDGCAAIVIWTRYNPAGVAQKSPPKP